MKRSLNRRETVFVASMLFGMFFGAGNLIFPVSMGQLSGSNIQVSKLETPLTLTQVFPNLFEGKRGVNVKV